MRTVCGTCKSCKQFSCDVNYDTEYCPYCKCSWCGAAHPEHCNDLTLSCICDECYQNEGTNS